MGGSAGLGLMGASLRHSSFLGRALHPLTLFAHFLFAFLSPSMRNVQTNREGLKLRSALPSKTEHPTPVTLSSDLHGKLPRS